MARYHLAKDLECSIKKIIMIFSHSFKNHFKDTSNIFLN